MHVSCRWVGGHANIYSSGGTLHQLAGHACEYNYIRMNSIYIYMGIDLHDMIIYIYIHLYSYNLVCSFNHKSKYIYIYMPIHNNSHLFNVDEKEGKIN